MKKIFILLGHPDKDTLSGDFATSYALGAQKTGHEVRRTNIGEMQFDPILHKGYKEIQALEPDLIKVQEDMKWADHFVIIYPNWWCTMPAILKGMWDRMFLPGFAFRMNKGKPGWTQLLKGKTSHVMVLAGTPPWLIRFMFGDFTNEIARGILGFAGYKVKVSTFGPSEKIPDTKKEEWKKKVSSWGEKAK